jgi:hypothetical protein
LGVRTVEEPGGLWTSIFPRHQSIYLPVSEDIERYLYLIRRGVIKETQVEGRTTKALQWTDWQLLDIPAQDVSKDKPIVIPSFEVLTKRELTTEQQELLKDLVGRYEKIETEAEKKMATPASPP